MAWKTYVTDSSLKKFLDTNSTLKDFIVQKQLVCRSHRDGMRFCLVKNETNSTEADPIVTVRWTRKVTRHLKNMESESFPADLADFYKNTDCRAVTTVLAYSIMALYLATGTELSTSKHIKVGFPQLGDQKFESASAIVPQRLMEAVIGGAVPMELAKRSFSFKMTMLPSHVVDGNICPHWAFPKLDELADLSYVWLRTRWTSWSIVYEFHESAPCGKGIYAWAAGGQETVPLNVQIKKNCLAIAAMHDNIYPNKGNNFKNEGIFENVCRDKTM